MEPDSILGYQRELTFSNEKDSVALGWFIMHYANGGEYVWHNGGTGGYSSSMAVDSNHRNAVVLLTNVGGKNDALDSACAKLMEYLLAEKG